MSFTSTPHEHGPLVQWETHLRGLQQEDVRRPFIAMAIRRAKQHIEKLTALQEGKTNECQESQSTPESVEEPRSNEPRQDAG